MAPPPKEQFIMALERTDKLVPGPRILGRALQLLHDPDSGLDEIAKLIRSDSALAVEVLRCANSAFYGRKAGVSDVADALQVIGYRETLRLLSLVATRHTTHRDLGSYGIAADDFWAESLYNGLFLEALAQKTGIGEAGETYITGLLRFVGRLAIDQVIHDLGGGLFWNESVGLSEWERENVGLTQAEVGARLLRRWEFPEPIVLAIELQDLSTLEGEGTQLPLVQAAHFVAQMLPAGCGLGVIDAGTEALVVGQEDHPFAKTHALTAETILTLRMTAHTAFIGVRETLYKPST